MPTTEVIAFMRSSCQEQRSSPSRVGQRRSASAARRRRPSRRQVARRAAAAASAAPRARAQPRARSSRSSARSTTAPRRTRSAPPARATCTPARTCSPRRARRWSRVADAVVVETGSDGGQGNYVHLYDPKRDGPTSTCTWSSRRRCRRGDAVDAGEQLGGVGCTGSCWGDHLHFEIRDGSGSEARRATRCRCCRS